MKLYKNEQGSIVVEAAVLMPFLFAALLAMTVFVHLASSELALQSAVNETTKQVAAHMYPLYLLSQENSRQPTSQLVNEIQSAKSAFNSYEQFSGDPLAMLPDMFEDMLLQQELELIDLESGFQFIQGKAFLPVLRKFTNERWLKPERLQIDYIEFPSFRNKQEAYFHLSATYRIQLKIPFFNRELLLQKNAMERVWIGS